MRAGLCKAEHLRAGWRLSATSRPPIPRSLYIPHARCWIWAQRLLCVSMGQEEGALLTRKERAGVAVRYYHPENLRRRCGRYR